jgi:hypothetical protein
MSNLITFGDGIIHAGANPYAATGSAVDGVAYGCPMATACTPLKWHGFYDRFGMMCRLPINQKLELHRIGKSPDSSPISEEYIERKLYQIKQDIEANEGVGLDDGALNSMMKSTHDALLRAVFGVFQSGSLKVAGQEAEQYWNGENPVYAAQKAWNADGNPMTDIEEALQIQTDHNAEQSFMLVLAHDAYLAFIANAKVSESAMWVNGSPNDLRLTIPRPIIPTATTRKGGGWLDAGMPWSAGSAQGGESIANPWFDYKGVFNGVAILKDKAGLIEAGCGVFLPRLDANDHGYRLVYGKNDIGGQISEACEIAIAKRSHRSGASLESHCHFGLALTDGNPYHSIKLTNLA